MDHSLAHMIANWLFKYIKPLEAGLSISSLIGYDSATDEFANWEKKQHLLFDNKPKTVRKNISES